MGPHSGGYGSPGFLPGGDPGCGAVMGSQAESSLGPGWRGRSWESGGPRRAELALARGAAAHGAPALCSGPRRPGQQPAVCGGSGQRSQLSRPPRGGGSFLLCSRLRAVLAPISLPGPLPMHVRPSGCPRRRRLAQRQAGLSPFPLSAVRLSSTCGLQGHSLIRKHGCFVLYLRLLLLFLRAGASLRQCLVLPSVRRGALEPPACRASSGLRDIAPSSSLPPPWPGASSRDTPLAAASQPGPVPQVPDLCHPPQPRLLPLRVP